MHRRLHVLWNAGSTLFHRFGRPGPFRLTQKKTVRHVGSSLKPCVCATCDEHVMSRGFFFCLPSNPHRSTGCQLISPPIWILGALGLAELVAGDPSRRLFVLHWRCCANKSNPLEQHQEMCGMKNQLHMKQNMDSTIHTTYLQTDRKVKSISYC